MTLSERVGTGVMISLALFLFIGLWRQILGEVRKYGAFREMRPWTSKHTELCKCPPCSKEQEQGVSVRDYVQRKILDEGLTDRAFF